MPIAAFWGGTAYGLPPLPFAMVLIEGPNVNLEIGVVARPKKVEDVCIKGSNPRLEIEVITEKKESKISRI